MLSSGPSFCLRPPWEKRTGNQTAFFLDRDGTLIRHVDYLHEPDKVELLPGVKETIALLLERSALVFILTNQSGVGRGYFDIDAVYACQRRLFELLEIKPSQLAGWCIAPEAPDVTGGYRKPSPRFIREAQAKFNFDLNNAHVIGDTLVDLETAWSAGAQPICLPGPGAWYLLRSRSHRRAYL